MAQVAVLKPATGIAFGPVDQNVPDDKTAMESSNFFCEGITEQSQHDLNYMVQLRDENAFAKLGRQLCIVTLKYELHCAEADLDQDELFRYSVIKILIKCSKTNAAQTTADQELAAYEASKKISLPQYTYCRIKQVVELLLRLLVVLEK